MFWHKKSYRTGYSIFLYFTHTFFHSYSIKKRKRSLKQHIHLFQFNYFSIVTFFGKCTFFSYLICIYEGHTISFRTFFICAFKNVLDSWKFSMLLLYILWEDWLVFMISGSNELLQQQLEYSLQKPDCHSWGISNMQSDALDESYAIKSCFKIIKMPHNRMECFRPLLEHLAWIEHEFLSGIRDSRKAGSLWVMMRGVGGARKSIH